MANPTELITFPPLEVEAEEITLLPTMEQVSATELLLFSYGLTSSHPQLIIDEDDPYDSQETL